MKNYKVKDVDTYISSATIEARPILKELRNIIMSTVSHVEEKISWGVPFYRYHGELGGFAVYKNHVTFGCGGADLQIEDREILEEKGYKTGVKSIQIKFDQKVPIVEIQQILQTKAKTNKAKRPIR